MANIIKTKRLGDDANERASAAGKRFLEAIEPCRNDVIARYRRRTGKSRSFCIGWPPVKE